MNSSRGDVYERHQKDAQYIHISGTNSTQTVSVPQLRANFFQVGADHYQDKFYQLKSFNFYNKFINVRKSDYVRIRITLGWGIFGWDGVKIVDLKPEGTFALEDEDRIIITRMSAPFQLYLSNNTDLLYGNAGDLYMTGNVWEQDYYRNDAQMTAYDIAQYLNYYLLAIAAAVIADPTLKVNPVYFCIYHLMYVGSFSFASDSGKIVFTLRSDASIPQPEVDLTDIPQGFARPYDDSYVNANTIPTNITHILRNVLVTLDTDPLYSEQYQTRMARYIGLPYNTSNDNFANYGLFRFDFTTNESNFRYFLYATFYQMAVRYTVAQRPAYYAIITAFLPTSPIMLYGGAWGVYGRILELAGPNAMDVRMFQQIVIRTSLNTNFWLQDGSKENVLDIIPVTSGIADIGTFVYYDNRTYYIKDYNAYSFYVQFTDENNTLIEFLEPYQMQIAVFFTRDHIN